MHTLLEENDNFNLLSNTLEDLLAHGENSAKEKSWS